MQSLTVAPARFAERTTVVAVVGLGKIGLPLAIQYAQRGRRVIGCDVNPHVVEAINAGRAHVREEPGLGAAVADAMARGTLSATCDTPAAVRAADVVVIIVPVMVTETHEIDFAAVDRASVAIGSGLTSGKLVIYETTLPVGTTAHRLRALLEGASGLEAGRDFYLAYSPERVSSGTIFRDLATYPKVVGGIDLDSAEAAAMFYGSVLDAEVTRMASASEAEFVKLIETTYRDVNIALANELARYADRRGLDAAAAVAAANTQPYSHIHTPGVGVGGHCIPVYPYFLLRDTDGELSLPRQARVINDEMAAYAVQRIEDAIGSLEGGAALILGVAYRADVREHAFSSARLLQSALLARGARVWAIDPLFEESELAAMGYTPFCPQWADEVQAIILQADHQVFQSLDFTRYPNCRAVLDGRWAMSAEAIRRLEALGIAYLGIGAGQRAAARTRERGA